MFRLDVLEFAGARALLGLFRSIGPVRASDLGGALARAIGPLLPVSRVADRNLRTILPGLDAAARRLITRKVWDNLGRTVAELPHLGALEFTPSGPGFEIEGAENLHPGRAIYVSAHFGNWEALPVIAARQGVQFSSVYREAKNTRVNGLIQSLRLGALRAQVPMFPKGSAGARGAVAHLAHGGAVGMLVDQKLNDGIEVRFIDQPAMTAPAAAAFAVRYGCPVIPGRIERVGPARLKLIVDPPLTVTLSGDREADIRTLTQQINDVLAGWIKAEPGAWLWLHRRWPKQVVAG